MSSAKYGVNIVITGNRIIGFAALIVIALLWSGCSSEKTASKSSGGRADDAQQIRDALNETLERWRYGDKSGLFDQEFDYVRKNFSYDRYLENERIKRMEADTVRAFEVTDIQFFDGDSAHVKVDVVFVGPTGDTTRLPQSWPMYYYQDRWIRPTLSSRVGQDTWDERRRVADSAASAEDGLGRDDW